VKLVGTHVGIGIGPDGYSQMALEDIACLRTLPNMAIIQPGDHRETLQAVAWAAQHNGPVYLRLTRQNLPQFHDDTYRFQPGVADVLQTGRHVCLIASGGTVEPAMQASELLAAQGIEVELVNLASIRPLDERYLGEVARRIGRIVTVEDHSLYGGVGGAVCEAIAETTPCPVLRLGMACYGESGEPEDLYRKYGFTGTAIAERVRAFIG
jgi:transketolase